MIDIIVLGAAAGGGFPQWNSNAPGCRRARAGDPAALPRTQASIAISGDGKNWFVVNASPDLRTQINQTPALHPSEGLRSTPIAGVILTGGEVDTITGLLTLRERQPFTLLATPEVLSMLDANPIFEALNRAVVTREPMGLDQPLALKLTDGKPAGLTIVPFAVPGKVPLYAESGPDPAAICENGETIGLEISDGSHRVCFVPGCARMTDNLRVRLRGADAVFFDGTLWVDDEMVRAAWVKRPAVAWAICRWMAWTAPSPPCATWASSAGFSYTSTIPTLCCWRIRPSAPPLRPQGGKSPMTG